MATFDPFGPHMRLAFALKTIAAVADSPEHTWEPATKVRPNFRLSPGIAIAGGWRRIVEVSFVLPCLTIVVGMNPQPAVHCAVVADTVLRRPRVREVRGEEVLDRRVVGRVEAERNDPVRIVKVALHDRPAAR